jgi:hypothetical protein
LGARSGNALKDDNGDNGAMALTQAETPDNFTREVFLSLTSADSGIASAIRGVFRDCFGNQITVFDSTSRELGSGIRHGEDWFEWIAERIRRCDFAFFLITPMSADKPWIIWEAGTAYGIALSAGRDKIRKIRPIIYQIDDDKIPAPLADLRIQFKRGDKIGDVKALFTDIIDHYRDLLTTDQFVELGNKLDASIRVYLKLVGEGLTKAPLLDMADRYLKINVSDRKERVRRKNDAAYEMARYLASHRIAKKDLAIFDHVEKIKEALIVALAVAISQNPEDSDVDLLLSVAADVTRYHVKFKIAAAVGVLVERCRVSEETIKSFEEILDKYEFDADEQLLMRIKETRNTMAIYGR